MSAKALRNYSPLETAVGSSARPADFERVQPLERRSSVRTKVHWPVLLRYRSSESVESVTENLSKQGFYCLSQVPIPPDEPLLCWLILPTHDPTGKRTSVVLECDVRVVRSDPGVRDGLFGLACRIDDYRLAHRDVLPAF
jgi:hypothetical protein